MNLRKPRWRLLAGAAGCCVATLLLWWVSSQASGTNIGNILEFVWFFAAIACFFAVPVMVIVALVFPERRDDQTWRQMVALYRRRRPLATKTPDEASVAPLLAGFSDAEVQVAAILPDHSEQGRARAALEVERRGLAGVPVPFAVVPSFFGPEDIDNPERHVFGTTSRVRGWAFLSAAALFGLCIVLIGWNVISGEVMVERALKAGRISAVEAHSYSGGTYDKTPPVMRQDPEMASIIGRERAAMSLISLWLPLLAVYFFATWFRLRPVRLLLLRKFNDPKLGKVYKRLAKNELGVFGHVIALSDRHVQRAFGAWLLAMIPITLPQLLMRLVWLPILIVLRLSDRTRWGPAFVASARDYRLLAKRLHDRMELNLEVSISSYAYLVRSTDAWWKPIIQLFIVSSDVIVLDVSRVTEGTSWEVDALQRLGLWGRVVVIANQASQEAAQAVARDLPGKDGGARQVFYYNSLGVLEARGEFQAAVFDALRAAVSAKAVQSRAA